MKNLWLQDERKGPSCCRVPTGTRVCRRDYLGRSKPFHDYIIRCARGSANQVRMAIGLLKEMSVEVPPLPAQRRIASILSAYDELMENSQRRIWLAQP